jgi:uncharacterized protein with FMN-binding domain
MEEDGGKKNLRTTLAVLIAIVLIVGGAIAFTKKKSSPTANAVESDSTSQSSAADTDSSTPDTQATKGTFKDGNYTATGNYVSPGGHESITVKVTLKDGVVTDTSAISGANDSDARDFQSQFIGGYKKLVVGKKIDSIRLSHVSGSSLTSQGFNDAIGQIKSQAKA